MMSVTTAVFLLTPHPDFDGYLGYLDIYYLSLRGSLWIYPGCVCILILSSRGIH